MKALDLKTKKEIISKAKYSTKVLDNNLQKKIAFSMFWIFGFLVLAYILFLGNTIFNIVERKTLQASSLELTNEVGNLELEYLSISNNIDLSLADQMGFRETQDKHFAVRRALGSLNIKNEL